MRNPRESTIGVVIDKKRCNMKDIEKVLDDMDSDGEYDIQILKKAKRTEATEKASKTTKNTVSSRRKKISIDSSKDDSEDDSNIEVIYRKEYLNLIQVYSAFSNLFLLLKFLFLSF